MNITINRIYFDFETTHNDPLKAEILEACFLFVNKNKEVIKKFHSKIKIEKLWNNLNEKELETLKFNKIYNFSDYEKHNKEAISWNKFWIKVLNFYYEYKKDDLFPLTGWNNAGFDNIILQRAIYPTRLNTLFDYHTRDLMHFFRRGLKEIGIIRGDGLAMTHIDLIGTKKYTEFHNSYVDCIAVKELDEYIDNKYKIVKFGG